MKNIRVAKSLLFILSFCMSISGMHDVSIVGNANIADGLGQHSLSFIDCLHASTSIQFVRLGSCKMDGLAPYARRIIKRGINLKVSKSKQCFDENSLIIYTGAFGEKHFKRYPLLPIPQDALRLAYSVFERTRVPDEWVKRLNKHFDAVLVPDPFLVDVYKNSGVHLPIFVLPLSLNLEHFLASSVNDFATMIEGRQDQIKYKNPRNVFAFGCSATFIDRKNHELIIDAFNSEFGNDPGVVLKIHGRRGKLFSSLKQKVKNLGTKNIFLSCKVMNSKKYQKFISSLDCYVLLSKGEGFSISPREALAAGVPCILSNNTAHQEICRTGFVVSVPSHSVREASSNCLERKKKWDFDCDIKDARKALREVYNNHTHYKKCALLSRDWAEQYTAQNLKQKYINLVRPQQILLGSRNEITETGLITTSKKLYDKYQRILSKKRGQVE